MDVQIQEQEAQTLEFKKSQTQEQAAERVYIENKHDFLDFLRNFSSDDYMFLTDGNNHFVYYVHSKKLYIQKIPFHTVHWNSETKTINWGQYGLNRSIHGDAIETDNEQFKEAYKKFYNLILQNLVKYALYVEDKKEQNPDILKHINSYVKKSIEYSNNYNDGKNYFEETKNNLNDIIDNISGRDFEADDYPKPQWYLNGIENKSKEIEMQTDKDDNNTAIPPALLAPSAPAPTVPPTPPAIPPAIPPANNTANPPTPPTDTVGSSPYPFPGWTGYKLNSTQQDVHGLMSSQLHDMLHDYAFTDNFRRTNGMDMFVKDVRDKLGYFMWSEYDDFDFNFPLDQRAGAVAQYNTMPAFDMLHNTNNPKEAFKDNASEMKIESAHRSAKKGSFVEPLYRNSKEALKNAKKINKDNASVMEIEYAHRPFVNRLYRYLYSWFVAHLYNDNTVDFDLQPNRDLFMAMTGSTESTLTSKVHNYFVESCFDAFKTEYEKTNNFTTFHNSISKTNSTKITDKNTLVEYFVLKKQSGGAGKNKANDNSIGSSPRLKIPRKPDGLSVAEQKERHKYTYNLLLTIAESFKKRYIPDYPKTYNHFLRAQQDVLNLAIRRENLVFFDLDTAILHQAIDIIGLNHPDNDILTHINVNRGILMNGTQQQRYIIDNSLLDKAFFEPKILCCQSTVDDGITEFGSHHCYDKTPVENDSTMNVKIWQSDDLYIQYARFKKNWQVKWKSNGNEFTYKLSSDNTLSSEDRFTAAIDNLVSEWSNIKGMTTSPQDKQVQRDALSDAMYQHIIFKSMGDILQELNGVLKNGGYIAPNFDYNSNDVIGYNNGDALRLVVSNDRPSASRILWYLYNGRNLGGNCKGESSNWGEYVNQQASGGFFNSNGYGSCFIYNPGRTDVVPNSTIIYRNDHEDYPLIPVMKDTLFIGKRITDNTHYYSPNNVFMEWERPKIDKPVLYQAYYICYRDPNNSNQTKKVYLNSLKFDYKYSYSPIIINVINEMLLNNTMTIEAFNTKVQDTEYDYEPNHGFMSIDEITQNNYFYYTTGDDFYIRDAVDGLNNTFNILKSLNNGTGFFYQQFVAPPSPPSPLPVNTQIIELLIRNNSVKVLNSEAYYMTYIKHNEPYSLVVYLENESDVTTQTHGNTIIPPLPTPPPTPPPGNQNSQSSSSEDDTASPMEEDLKEDAKIEFKDLLNNIQSTYYNGEVVRFPNVKKNLKTVFEINENNENPEITAKNFKDKIDESNMRNLSKLKKLTNKQINELFIPPQNTNQAGGATEENMNPVIYAGVSILVLLGALTGLKM